MKNKDLIFLKYTDENVNFKFKLTFFNGKTKLITKACFNGYCVSCNPVFKNGL